jgi:hypothetical protein
LWGFIIGNFGTVPTKVENGSTRYLASIFGVRPQGEKRRKNQPPHVKESRMLRRQHQKEAAKALRNGSQPRTPQRGSTEDVQAQPTSAMDKIWREMTYRLIIRSARKDRDGGDILFMGRPPDKPPPDKGRSGGSPIGRSCSPSSHGQSVPCDANNSSSGYAGHLDTIPIGARLPSSSRVSVTGSFSQGRNGRPGYSLRSRAAGRPRSYRGFSARRKSRGELSICEIRFGCNWASCPISPSGEFFDAASHPTGSTVMRYYLGYPGY